MFNDNDLQKIIFFNVKTASGEKDFNELSLKDLKLSNLWSKRCEYLRSRFEENKNLSDYDLYQKKAFLHPEFNRIICASFGRIELDKETGSPFLLIKNYFNDNEKIILNQILKVFNNNKLSSFKFASHNTKRFDIPTLSKRFLINGIEIPKSLLIYNLKPWETPFIDLSEIWGFGAWQESFVPLELISHCLNVDHIYEYCNEDINDMFWKKKDYEKITNYCNAEVFTISKIFLKLSNSKLVENIKIYF